MKTILRRVLDKIEEKNSWGKNELKMLILDMIADPPPPRSREELEEMLAKPWRS